MNEYINKADALAAFTTIGSIKALGGQQCAAVVSKIQNMSAADVEEITRCGACAFCEIRNNDESICHKHYMIVDNDYYCADGVKGEWMP